MGMAVGVAANPRTAAGCKERETKWNCHGIAPFYAGRNTTSRRRDGYDHGPYSGTDVIDEPKGGFHPQEAVVGEATEATRNKAW